MEISKLKFEIHKYFPAKYLIEPKEEILTEKVFSKIDIQVEKIFLDFISDTQLNILPNGLEIINFKLGKMEKFERDKRYCYALLMEYLKDYLIDSIRQIRYLHVNYNYNNYKTVFDKIIYKHLGVKGFDIYKIHNEFKEINLK